MDDAEWLDDYYIEFFVLTFVPSGPASRRSMGTARCYGTPFGDRRCTILENTGGDKTRIAEQRVKGSRTGLAVHPLTHRCTATDPWVRRRPLGA